MISAARTLAKNVFVVPAASIKPLATPTEFYDTLIHQSQTAQKRVSLGSLYVGTGPLEQRLIQSLRNQILRHPSMEVRVQLDYSRALRPTTTKSKRADMTLSAAEPIVETPSKTPYSCSAQLLLELVQPYKVDRSMLYYPNVHCGLTLMPQLRGTIASKILPQRFIEGQGVFHMKAYAFDNSVVLSGANLSEDYFTNRQDRYVLIDNVPEFATYIHNLLRDLQQLPGSHMLGVSGQVEPVSRSFNDFDVVRRTAAAAPTSQLHRALDLTSSTLEASKLPSVRPGRGLSALEHSMFCSSLKNLLQRNSADLSERVDEMSLSPTSNAILKPYLQLGALGCKMDELNTKRILGCTPPARNWATATDTLTAVVHMATGYFNVTKDYMHAIVKERSDTSVHVVTAGPKANGFFGGHTISGAIPMAYSEILREFVRYVYSNERHHDKLSWRNMNAGISAYEYERPGWTFHGKGAWLAMYAADQLVKMLTLVGSSNFGRRSVERDLELSVQIETQDAALMERLEAEKRQFFESSGRQQTQINPVALHVEEANVWKHKERQIDGWTYERGLWIHVVRRILAAHF